MGIIGSRDYKVSGFGFRIGEIRAGECKAVRLWVSEARGQMKLL